MHVGIVAMRIAPQISRVGLNKTGCKLRSHQVGPTCEKRCGNIIVSYAVCDTFAGHVSFDWWDGLIETYSSNSNCNFDFKLLELS